MDSVPTLWCESGTQLAFLYIQCRQNRSYVLIQTLLQYSGCCMQHVPVGTERSKVAKGWLKCIIFQTFIYKRDRVWAHVYVRIRKGSQIHEDIIGLEQNERNMK